MLDDLKAHINKLREDFSHSVLHESDVDPNPSEQFKLWLHQAVEARVPELQAMNIATVSSEGKPSARIVYMREFENDQYWFYTNYNSKKALELEKNPFVCATFFWKELERQVRIEGAVTKATTAQSDDYFDARPYDSKIGAWASEQSKKLLSRADLDQKVEELKKKFSPENISRPPFWGGYIITANYYEFWQGRKSRLHDRIVYERKKDIWNTSRIAP